jgi:hypothetical protein
VQDIAAEDTSSGCSETNLSEGVEPLPRAPSERATIHVTDILASGQQMPASAGEAKDTELIESLLERSGFRFGDEFEARVRELVAQRVAEIVAERMLTAFATGAVPSVRNGQRQSNRVRSHTKSASHASGPSESVPANATTSKARRSDKQQKSPTVESREPKRR